MNDNISVGCIDGTCVWCVVVGVERAARSIVRFVRQLQSADWRRVRAVVQAHRYVVPRVLGEQLRLVDHLPDQQRQHRGRSVCQIFYRNTLLAVRVVYVFLEK